MFALLSVALSCSLDTPTNQGGENTTDNKVPNTPIPADKSVDQFLVQTLRWEASDAAFFDIYFGKTNPPNTKLTSNLDKKFYIVSNLEYNTTYYWKVVSKISDGTSKEGPVWNFRTAANTNPLGTGYAMQLYKSETKLPHNINMIFQVVDMSRRGVSNLKADKFEIFEDGLPLTSESALEIKKSTELPYKIRTVLMLDNSTSLVGKYEQIKAAAANYIRNIQTNQEVAIYQFSDGPELLIDFTSSKESLLKFLENYKQGFMTTNLYGATIKGASRWEDKYSTDEVLQGTMIIFTDGKDTQGSRTLAEAINSVANKIVFTVGLNSVPDGIDEPVLTSIGTNGFYKITDVSQLTEQFTKIQSSIIDYANSFYVLSYKSPKRGNYDHFLTIRIKENSFTGEGSYITGIYNSSSFYSAKRISN